MAPAPLLSSAAAQSCRDCPARQRCLPQHLADDDCASVARLVRQRYLLQRGEHLYRMHEPVRERLYAVQSGQFKTYQLSSEGQQRVSGFQSSGDFLGLDAIGLQYHRNSTMALCDAVLCEFSHQSLVDAALGSATIALQFRRLLSKQLAGEQEIAQLLSQGSVDQKLASFLLQQAASQAPGHAGTLQLHMTRRDIGDYLGLTSESVSRALSRFQHQGYLALHRRQLAIADPAAIRAIATGDLPPPWPQPEAVNR